jgi:hypothetical protein
MKLPVVKYRFVEETAWSDERRQSRLYCIAVDVIQGYCSSAPPVSVVAYMYNEVDRHFFCVLRVS